MTDTTMKETRFRDPVCGMEGPLAKSAGHARFRGARYDFCSRECQRSRSSRW